MERKINDFVTHLANTQVPVNVTNQYDNSSPLNAIRRNNLIIYLNKMVQVKPRILLIAEAPGHRGSRITGVPLTSENILMNEMSGVNFFGKANGYQLPKNYSKFGKQATTTIIWEVLIELNILPLLLNAFPFHPHQPGNYTSNRTPLKSVIEMGKCPLLELMSLFKIQNVIAIGRKAEGSLKSLKIPAHYVRHPAQGGKNEFVTGMRQFISKSRL